MLWLTLYFKSLALVLASCEFWCQVEPLNFNFSVFLFYIYNLLHFKLNSLKMKSLKMVEL